MAQKDHAQHRHAVLAAGQFGIGAELVGGVPQAGFNLGDAVEGVGGHVSVLLSTVQAKSGSADYADGLWTTSLGSGAASPQRSRLSRPRHEAQPSRLRGFLGVVHSMGSFTVIEAKPRCCMSSRRISTQAVNPASVGRPLDAAGRP